MLGLHGWFSWFLWFSEPTSTRDDGWFSWSSMIDVIQHFVVFSKKTSKKVKNFRTFILHKFPCCLLKCYNFRKAQSELNFQSHHIIIPLARLGRYQRKLLRFPWNNVIFPYMRILNNQRESLRSLKIIVMIMYPVNHGVILKLWES